MNEVILNENGEQKIIEIKPILGSHNSFTYCKPRNLLSWIGIPIGRCQTKNIEEQIKLGIRLLDIRVRFDNSGYIYLCHGYFEVKLKIPVIEYNLSGKNTNYVLTDKFKFPNFIEWLTNIVYKNLPENENFYFRLVLEISKENIIQEMFFKNFCEYFKNYLEKQKLYPKYHILSCVRKFDWKQLSLPTDIDSCFQHISSYCIYPEAIKVRWYEKLFPWVYAKRTNKKFLENLDKGIYNNYDSVSYDFV